MPPKNAWNRLKIGLSYVAAAACLVWVFHDIYLSLFVKSLAAINWPLAALGLIIETATYFVMGLRWGTLLKSKGEISTLRTTQAIYSGLFLNNILPLRIGELTRGYLVSRWMNRALLAIVPSMVLERLFEGFWMALGIGILAMLVPLPQDFILAGKVFGAIIVVLAIAVIVLISRKSGTRPGTYAQGNPKSRFWRHGVRIWGHLRAGFQDIGLSKNFFAAIGLSLAVIFLFALTFWILMQAYGIRVSLLTGLAVWLITHSGIALPNTPGNVGSYQFFCVLGLRLFGIDKTLATGFSVVAFLLVSTPQVVVGFAALARSGMTLSELRNRLKKIKI